MKRIIAIYSALLIAGAVVLFLLNFQLFSLYIQVPVPSGNDSYGHVAIGEYYANNIFPATWGWASKWFDGMPFPQFYPPLFYFLTAIVSFILPLSYAGAFKAVVLVLTLVIPGLLGMILYKYTKNIWAAGFTTGIGAVLLSMFYPQYGNMGVTLQSTFHVGLVPHLMGFVFLILWIFFFFNAHKSARDYYLSILALTAAFLSSVHILQVALVIYCVQFIVLERRTLIRPHTWFKDKKFIARTVRFIGLGALPVGVSFFWYLPMLAHYSEMAGRSLGIDSGPGASGVKIFYIRWAHLIFFTIAAAVLAYRKKHLPLFVVSISSLLLFVPVALHVERLIPQFPIHIYRSLPCFYMLSAISVGYCLYRIISYLPQVSYKIFFTVIFISPFVVAWIPIMNSNKISDIYLSYKRDRAEEIADFLKDKTGMFSVEVAGNSRALEYIISRKAGPHMQSDYNILVESAIASPFMVPVRGAYSLRDERMSVDAYLRANPVFRNQGYDEDAKRAQILGINYFLVSTPKMKEEMQNNPHMQLEKDFGVWRVYKLKEQVFPPVKALPYEPTIVFAESTFKKRSTTTFDFVRFQEELFLNPDPTLILALRNDPHLDTTSDLDRFTSAIIAEYTYKDLDKAVARLMTYSESHPLVLIESQDPLFAALKEKLTHAPNVRFVSQQTAKEGNQKPVRDAMKFVLDFLKSRKQPIADVPAIKVFTLQNTQIDVTLATSTSIAKPILISSTYFSAWKRTDGEATYMASPVYTLTYIKDSATVKFTNPPSLIIGCIISVITLVGTAYLIYRDTRKSMR